MKNKIKFQRVTLTLSKKELKLLFALVGSLSVATEQAIVKGIKNDFSKKADLFQRLAKEMDDQNVKYPCADIIISVND